MNGNDETGRDAARHGRVGWTAAAVMVGLAVGTVAGLRLASSAQVTAETPVAIAMVPNPASFEEARSRLVQRRLDHSKISESAADSADEPGMSIAAYGN